LYALIERLRHAPVASSLASAPPGSKPGSRRLSQEQEAAIEEAIRDIYLTRQKACVSVLHDEIRRLCRKRGLTPPSWKAVRARVESVDRYKLVSRRQGAKAARDRLRPVTQEYRAEHALQVIQIDHTRVDLFVVDAVHRQPIQRPWLTLAIDVASRMVAGFYLSLEAPSSASVALAIHHAVTPKALWLAASISSGQSPGCRILSMSTTPANSALGRWSAGTILPLRPPSRLEIAAVRKRVLELTEGVTARIFRLIETAAVEAIRSGAECLDANSFAAEGLAAPLVAMPRAAEARLQRRRVA